jgi:Zn-dependent M32 family carboxypeptidase
MESSSMPPAASKVIQTNNKEVHEELVSITEKIDLTKKQHEVLKIICNTYEISLLEYIQQAVVEAMQFDIEEAISLMLC